MKHGKISNNTIRRMPRYLRALDELTARGTNRVSSFELGHILGFTASQVRQDFSCFGTFGQQGYGYHVPALREQISQILGMHKGRNAILIGCGNIGKALLCNFDFSSNGINMLCGFDTNPELVGTHLNGIEIRPVSELGSFIADKVIDMAVLCVPPDSAEKAADALNSCGVEAIWNFTNADISSPGSKAVIENFHFSDSLLTLCYHIKERATRC